MATQSQPAQSDRSARIPGDLPVLALLFFALLLYVLPGLMQWEGLLFDDGAHLTFPQMVAVARSMQDGEIPLWDPATFCGGRPFYAMPQSPERNLLLFPLFLLADLDNLDHAYAWLFLAPLALFMLLAGIGSFLFARQAVGLHRLAAVVLAVTYVTAPHMGVSVISIFDTCTFALLPWVLLAIARFVVTRSAGWGCAGAALLALLACSRAANYTIRIYFVTAFVAGMLWLLGRPAAQAGLRKRPTRSELATLLGVAGIYLLSLGLGAVMWAGVLDGIRWISGEAAMTYEHITERPLRPGHLVTLFAPNFNGTLTQTHAWGSALKQSHLFVLSGGLCLGFAWLAACIFWLRHKPADEPERRIKIWVWIGALVLAGTLLTLLGKYTPAFRVFCWILPWFFKIPYPDYYHFAACWSISLLAGIAVHSMCSLPAFRAAIARRRWFFTYLALVLAGMAAALFEPVQASNGMWVKSHVTLSMFNEWRWLFTRPLLYVAVFALVLTGSLFTIRRNTLFPLLLAVGLVFETTVTGYLVLYRSEVSPRLKSRCAYDRAAHARAKSPLQHPQLNAAVALSAQARKDPFRWIGAISDADNLAWLADAHAALGYDAKPVLPRVRDAFGSFTAEWPYQVWTVYFPEYFLKNMNVGRLLAQEGMTDPDGLKYGRMDDLAVIWLRDPRSMKDPVPNYRELVTGPKILSLDLPQPLPYAYTQDRVVPLDATAQKQRLLGTDLRAAAYVDPADARQWPSRTSADVSAPSPVETQRRFSALQASNPILSLQRASNSRRIEIDMHTAALLVMAEAWHEGWHASVDGQPLPLLQVNYLQQGLWLPPGRHTVDLRFEPRCVWIGKIISLASFTLLFGIAGAILMKRLKNR